MPVLVRRPLLLSALAGLAIGAAGCGEDAEPAAGESAAELHIEQRFIGDSLYVEGSISFVELSQGDSPALERELEGDMLVLRLRPGAYELRSYQRPCDGNCSVLGDPADQCTRELELTAAKRYDVVVRVRPGEAEGCRIAVRSAS